MAFLTVENKKSGGYIRIVKATGTKGVIAVAVSCTTFAKQPVIPPISYNAPAPAFKNLGGE